MLVLLKTLFFFGIWLRASLLTTCFAHYVWLYRGNMVDAFRMHIMQTKELGTCPVRQIGGCSFLYMRISNVYIVIVVSSNANVACAFKFVVEVCNLYHLWIIWNKINITCIHITSLWSRWIWSSRSQLLFFPLEMVCLCQCVVA